MDKGVITWAEKFSLLEKRVQFIEDQLGISDLNENSKEVFKKIKKQDPEPEKTVGGFTKEQLKIMFTWAKGLRLNQLTKNDFEELKRWEILRDFYPDAPDNYEDIKR